MKGARQRKGWFVFMAWLFSLVVVVKKMEREKSGTRRSGVPPGASRHPRRKGFQHEGKQKTPEKNAGVAKIEENVCGLLEPMSR
jgi:hypothetical protein